MVVNLYGITHQDVHMPNTERAVSPVFPNLKTVPLAHCSVPLVAMKSLVDGLVDWLIG
jgi:hypothetical protein